MKTEYHIRILQRDIDAGQLRMLSRCPVALAIRRQSPDETVEVFSRHVWLWSAGLRRDYALPDRMRKWIDDYDLGSRVAPTSFVLRGI